MSRRTMDVRRRMAAWVLLWVFVPMMVLSGLHVHEVGSLSDDACLECVHHVPHGGHLSSHVLSVDDCLICQFSALPFLAAVAVATIMVCSQKKTVLPDKAERPVFRIACGSLLRGPPAVS